MVQELTWRDDEWVEVTRVMQLADGWREARLTLGRQPAFSAKFGLMMDAIQTMLDGHDDVMVIVMKRRTDDDKGASDAGD
jgi:hypothetical protein